MVKYLGKYTFKILMAVKREGGIRKDRRDGNLDHLLFFTAIFILSRESEGLNEMV